MKRLVLGLSILLFLSISMPVIAGGVTTYDFEEVSVDFASEFIAHPVEADVYNWFTYIAGGPENPLQVLYGVVNLKSTHGVLKEEFIKITGQNGSERFLANSMTTGWYDPGTYEQLKYIEISFWSAKKLEGTTVVKDLTEPIKIVTLKKNFDENQKLTSINLYFSSDTKEFRSEIDSSENFYQADMSNLVYKGDPTARK